MLPPPRLTGKAALPGLALVLDGSTTLRPDTFTSFCTTRHSSPSTSGWPWCSCTAFASSVDEVVPSAAFRPGADLKMRERSSTTCCAVAGPISAATEVTICVMA